MNPTVLNFSKGWSIVQLAMMIGFGAVLLWLLSESSVFAEPPPPSFASADLKAEGDPIEFATRLIEARPRQESAVDRLTGGWFTAGLLIACIPLLFWEIAMRSWRLFTSAPALEIQNGQLVPHASFWSAPEKIAIQAIRNATFDRADRVRGKKGRATIKALSRSSYLGLKLGLRLRHSLLIDYQTEQGEPGRFKLSDSDVAGGVEQLIQFVAYLKYCGIPVAGAGSDPGCAPH